MKASSESLKAVASEFHAALHGSSDATYILLDRDASGMVIGANWRNGSVESLYGEFEALNKAGSDVLLMVNKTDGKGPSADNVVAVTAYAVDIDHGDPAVLKSAGLTPRVVVKTSTNRRHAVWPVTSHPPTADDKVALLALAETFRGDHVFARITQAVRVPGFINHKYAGTRVKLSRDIAEVAPYSVEKFNAYFDVPLWQRQFFDNNWPVKAVRIGEENGDAQAKDINAALQYIKPDDYHDWIKVGFALRHVGEVGFRLWDDWSRGSDKYKADEIAVKWKSFPDRPRIKLNTVFWLARRAGWSPPAQEQYDAKGFAVSERALGRAIARQMRADYRVVANSKQARFYRWNGERFAALDERGKRNAVEDELERLLKGLDSAHSASKRDSAGLRKDYGTNRAIDALSESVADAFSAHAVDSPCDRSPYLGCENGMLNLLTGKLVNPQLRPFSQLCATARFDPDALCPRFDLYLDEVFEGDQAMKSFVLRLLGYTLLGDPKEHLFVILHGKNGRNGKSKLINVVEAILGEYFQRLPVVSVLAKSHTVETTTPAFAKLRGKRVASFDEVNVQQKLDTGLVKAMTGGDGINARALYGDQQHFRAEFTPLMIANFLPEIRDDDPAMWARGVIGPFNRSFTKNEMDVDLEKKLVAEKSGILNRLLEGIQDYMDGGLRRPKVVRDEVQDARFKANSFEVWLEDRCELAESSKTSLRDLLADYRWWRRENPGHRLLGDREFQQRLGERFEATKPQNKVHYRGVGLRFTLDE